MAPVAVVRYLTRAAKDLEDIVDYLLGEAPAAAEGFLDHLEAAAAQLIAHPECAAPVRDSVLAARGFRCLPVSGYLVFYKVEEGDVVVYRVLHGARAWSRLL